MKKILNLIGRAHLLFTDEIFNHKFANLSINNLL